MQYFFRVLILVCAALAAMPAAAHRTVNEAANRFAAATCDQPLPTGWACHWVERGESWEQLFPDAALRVGVMKFNRQNQTLKANQMVVIPPLTMSWQQLSPLPRYAHDAYPLVVVFDPARLAWGYYENGVLQHWGPAVGGKRWCPDKNNNRGGPCLTAVGVHVVTEAADADRRSTSYPRNCRGRSCAPMPYYVRFTSYGQGFHARSISGAHASHGCVGLFADDAIMLNKLVRATVGRERYGWFTQSEIARSVPVIVLPYESREPLRLAQN